jgi:hypothetical protein
VNTPPDREFQVLRSGFVRDNVILASFREGLRARVNPETGAAFTDEEIQRATRPGTRFYVEAQAIDDYGQQDQRGALYLADQIRIDRSTGKWLLDVHGKLWNVTPLPASGGSGPVRITATPGTIIRGSTTLGDPNAHAARDPAGNLYQVFTPGVAGAGSTVTLTMAAVSTGSGTNPTRLTTLVWTNRDPNMAATAIIDDQFSGGTDAETEAEYADRIASIVAFKPGAGNNGHFRAWARESTNAVKDGFIYPCALHNGSTIAAILQKRGSAVGPLARIPSPVTLATAVAYLTPPTSPVVPEGRFVITVPPASEPVDLVMRLTLPRSSNIGWKDAQPFPAYHATTPVISNVVSQTHFSIASLGDATLPGMPALSSLPAAGVPAPKFMIWNVAKSLWVELSVATITDLGGNVFDVVLLTQPDFTLTAGMFVSPATSRAGFIAQTLTEYFDERGPGDFFDTDVDARGARCLRFPDVNEYPTDVGATVVTAVLEALQGAASNGVASYLSQTTPSFQPSPQLGPKMLTLGRVAILDL